MTNFKVSNFNVKLETGDNFLKYCKTQAISHIWEYLDCTGLKLYTPFINLTIKGWEPIENPSHVKPIADNAERAVFIAL